MLKADCVVIRKSLLNKISGRAVGYRTCPGTDGDWRSVSGFVQEVNVG